MFEKYPFEKLNELLKDVPHPEEVLSLTIGEPQFETPKFIQDSLCKNAKYLNKYPKTAGEEVLKEAQRGFVKRRYSIELKKDELLPSFGTRELLFNFPLFLRPKKTAFPNPFYQIYEGAAIAAGSEINYMELKKENDFKNRLSQLEGDEDFIILNTPNNPTASVMSLDELSEWVEYALKNDVVILSDECYSELYIDEKPPSILEAAINVGNKNFKNILAINSISKRSSAPGLRSGFIAGDSEILKRYLSFRTYVGCASPLPLQYAAAEAWSDDEHVEPFREKYRKNFEIAKEILGVEIPKATFYIWLEVGDDIEFTKEAYKRGVKVMPGRFMGRKGAGEGYVRIALVYDEERTKKALKIIKELL
ncbi:succinyldiaminopimelate transaminase [Caminibacter pacificus]|uniref:Aspartate/methionine/tyrosine aminotransferase n=1 Tax=Caminibacter pacificus TaxID=1424653 RepID=A0AAJ4RDX2_9BACT|nr:succinyldiaminopimelate transaminase [Caminibacter pacificus]QCI28474.1 succinyldiaminopimelate transaminase [Caminibacter pacificus]ROR40799.1 aspartate/methionine/tyrosine aminotransferase [Caminibacter pacificus]